MKRFIAFASILFFLMTSFAFAGNLAESGSESEANAGASITFDDHSTNKSKIIDRQFVGSSPSVTAGTNGLFVPPSGADISFRPLRELIRFGAVFSEGALIQLAKGGDTDLNFSWANDYTDTKPSNIKGGQRFIKIVMIEPADFKLSAFVAAAADDYDTNSFQVIAEAGLAAIRNGDNILFIEFEGYNDKVHASGWGIGTHTASGVVSGTGKVSGVGGGGFGYSSNGVGNEQLPWIRGYSGFVPEINIAKTTNRIRARSTHNDRR